MKKIFSIVLLTIFIVACKQNSTTMLDAFETLNESEEVYEVSTMSRNQKLLMQLQDSAIENPDKFAGAFNDSVDFHDKTTALNTQINQVKDVIYDFIGETEDFANKHKTADSLLFNGDQLSETSLIFKEAMHNYMVSTSDQLYFYPKAEKAAAQITHLSSNNKNLVNKVDSILYSYKGLTSIDILTEMSDIQQQVLKVETLFLKGLLLNPRQ